MVTRDETRQATCKVEPCERVNLPVKFCYLYSLSRITLARVTRSLYKQALNLFINFWISNLLPLDNIGSDVKF